MTASHATHTKRLIRRRYAQLAAADSFRPDARADALAAGVPAAWFDALPPRVSGVFSGCGWPAAQLEPAGLATVVDLGCGGGLDARYLAERLDASAQVIAVDLTPETLVRTRETAAGAGRAAVRLLAADMERLPLADGCADAVIANAALNLATDKAAAFAEIARILRPGGRLVAADLVREGELPADIRADPMSMATSLGGVMEQTELRGAIEAAGLHDVKISGHRPFGPVVAVNLSARKI